MIGEGNKEIRQNSDSAKRYYEVHLSFDHVTGYSEFFESYKQLLDDEEILEEACSLGFVSEDDAEYMDYAVEITEGEYIEIKGKE